MSDFAHASARRTRLRGGDELTTILAGSPPGVLSMTGGFPNPATFPTDELDEIAARLVREDAAVALQYTPCAGIPSVREYLLDRQEEMQGRRPEPDELIARSEHAILAAQDRGASLHDMTNHADHVAALDRGEPSALAFRVDV